MKSDDDSAKPKAKSKGARLLRDPLGVMYEQDYRDYLLEFEFEDEWQTEHRRRAEAAENRIQQGIDDEAIDPDMPVPLWVVILLILPFLLVLLYALLVRFSW